MPRGIAVRTIGRGLKELAAAEAFDLGRVRHPLFGEAAWWCYLRVRE